MGKKTLLYSALEGILGDRIRNGWTFEEMVAATAEQNNEGQYKIAINTLGAHGFTQLLMDRAQQIGLVSVHDRLHNGGDITECYEVKHGQGD